MRSTSMVLQLPASSASLLSHQQVTGEEQQRDRGDPGPVRRGCEEQDAAS